MPINRPVPPRAVLQPPIEKLSWLDRTEDYFLNVARNVGKIIRVLVWIGCIIIVVAEWSSTSLSLGSKEISAIQQSGLAAMGCFQVLVAYVICRAIDSMTR